MKRCASVLLLAGLMSAVSPALAAPPASSTDLFSLQKLWDVRLEFPAGQWQALEPKGGGEGPMGGRGGFNPNRFMAPVWLKALDANQDASVTRDEFLGAFRRWSSEWDQDKKGHLDTDSLREGFNRALSMEPGGPGGPGGSRPGGRPGGGGFGPMLLAKEGGRNGLSGAAGLVFEYVHADLEIGGTRLTNVAVRYKGNGTFMGSRMTDKKSLKVDLNEFVSGQKFAGVGKINLHNNVTDASWMNEPLSYALYRDAGVPAPRSSYARVRVTAPGVHTNDYLGLYSIVENPDNRWAEARFGTKKGAIFKPVTPTLFQHLGDDWKAYQQIYDAKTELTAKQKQRVMEFARLVTLADDAEFARRAPEFLDVDAFGRFMAVTVWLSTLDSILTLGQNYVMYLHPKTDRFQFVPWDLDHSFGNFPMQGSQDQREQLSIQKPWSGQNRFFERVFAVPAFKEAYLARMKEFQGSIFQPERLARQVDEVAVLLRPAVAEESTDKLERFNQVVAGKAVASNPFGGPPGRFRGPGGPGGPGGRGGPGENGRPGGPGGPGGFGGPGGPGGPGRGGPGMNPFGDPPKPIKGFVPLRHQSVAAQLAGTSSGMELGAPGGPGNPGGRGGRGGPGGPGGPGGRGGPGGPGGFGPGLFIAQPVTDAADADHDGKITAREWNAMAERWWTQWDKAQKGSVNEEQIVDGPSAVFPLPPGGPPPR